METPAQDPSPNLRRRVGLALLGLACGLLVLSFFLQRGSEDTSTTAKVIAWSLGASSLVMALSVLVFGTLNVFWLVKIDLRRGRTVFHVGVPWCSIRLSGTWEAGAFPISGGHGIFLVVPTMARLIAIVVTCYLVYGLLLGSMSGWYAAGITIGVGLVLWTFSKKLRGAPQPSTADSEHST